MMAWLRLYDTIPNDPKIQSLSGDMFKFWINILCLAKRQEGQLTGLDDIAWILRLSRPELDKSLQILVKHNLLSCIDTESYAVHDWEKWQYKSDVSTERVKRFRKQDGNVSGNESALFCSVSVSDSVSGVVSAKKSKAGMTAEQVQWFDLWWARYPRKVAKANAARAFQKIVLATEQFERIMAGLERQMPDLTAQPERFRPHAATWLNGKRWEDEPVQSTASEPTADDLRAAELAYIERQRQGWKVRRQA
jgi:hypothetical protein